MGTLCLAETVRKLAERGTRWLLTNRRPPLDLTGAVSFFVTGVNGLLGHLPKLLTGEPV